MAPMETPIPDPAKLLAYWDEWERGDDTARPGDGQPQDRGDARAAAPAGGGLTGRRGERLATAAAGQVIPRPDGLAPGRSGAVGRRPGRRPVRAGCRDRGRRRPNAVARDPARPDLDDAPLFPDARPSAVLLALHDGPTGAEVVLTRRSRDLRATAARSASPAAASTPGETPEQASAAGGPRGGGARSRRPSSWSAACPRWPPSSVCSHIVPVVGRLQGRPELRPAAAEVERILHVPLVELTEPDVFREEHWGEGALRTVDLLLRARRRDHLGRDGPHPRRAALRRARRHAMRPR